MVGIVGCAPAVVDEKVWCFVLFCFSSRFPKAEAINPYDRLLPCSRKIFNFWLKVTYSGTFWRLCLRQAIRGRRHNVFYLSVRPSVRPSVRYVRKLVNMIFRKRMKWFWCKLAHVAHKAVAWNGQRWGSAGQRSKVKVTRGRTEKHHSRPTEHSRPPYVE